MEIIQEKEKSEICSHVKNYSLSLSSLHYHKRYEICQVIDKPCRFLIDGVYIEADAGDIITIDEQLVHRFLIDSNDTHIRIIQFPTRILLNTGISIKPLKMHITQSEIRNVENLEKTLNNLFNAMDQEGIANLANDNPFLQAMCISVYFLLMRNFAGENHFNSTQKDRKEFFEIIDYVNKHFTENIDVTSIASTLYISRGRLASLFLKFSGTGLNDYINSLRIKTANNLIISGHTITEAALGSGFQTIRTFNNAYKSIMGITPSEFIKRNLQNNN